MRPIFHILFLTFLPLSVFALNIYPINAVGEVIVNDNYSSYIASSGAFHVVGEVENIGDTNVEEIYIKVTYYDADDRSIGSQTSSSLQNLLLPGMKSPFDVILTGSSVGQVDSYELEVSFIETDKVLNRTLVVLSDSFFSNITGKFYVFAEVKNNGTEISNATNVIATFYDSSGIVVATGESMGCEESVRALNLNPGQTESFPIIIKQPQSTKIASYEVIAVSNEAIIIPEFKYTLMILLVGCLFVFAVSRMKKDSSNSIIRTQ